MRLPDPIANTTTEAYLAYKAGVLNIGDLKPSLYDPYLHYDAWLAYWAGLVDTYPIHDVGKNLYNKATATSTGYYHQNISNEMPVEPGLTYTFNVTEARNYAAAYLYDSNGTRTRTIGNAPTTHTLSFTVRNNEVKVVLDFYAELNVDVSTYDFTGVQFELGSTATPYEPYTGTPEMLTDEEALVAYLSGVTNTYPEEYSDPIDARITGYLRYLVSARFGRPDYPVNNIEFYLSLMKPPIVTNETPSANIELDDTVEAAFVDVKMCGDTFQQTYSGKNMLNIDVANYSNWGLNFTNNGDGTITVSGTTTHTSGYVFPLATAGTRNALKLTSGKTYTQRVEVVSGTKVMNVVPSFKNSGGTITYNYFQDNSTKTPTENLTCNAYDLYVSSLTTGTQVNFTLRIWLEEGSDQSSSFEPYVGGIPAPNPDYPQTVQTVTGRQKVIINGKNVLDYNNDRITNTYIRSDNGAVVGGVNGALTVWARVIKNTDYILSRDKGDRLVIAGFDAIPKVGDRGYLIYDGAQGDLTEKTFNSGEYNYIGIFIARQASAHPTWAQIEAGSTATAYTPYQGQSCEVNLGNIELCKIGDYQDYIYKDGQQWYVHKEIGKSNLATDGVDWISSTTRVANNRRWCIRVTQTDVPYLSDSTAIFAGFCSHLEGKSRGDTYNEIEGIALRNASSDTGVYLTFNMFIESLKTATTQDFKFWLAANTPVVYYQSTTPTDTEITNSALIDQLEALLNSSSYNGKTYITVEAAGPNLPALLKVEAGAE